jgi:hypothetical protein
MEIHSAVEPVSTNGVPRMRVTPGAPAFRNEVERSSAGDSIGVSVLVHELAPGQFRNSQHACAISPESVLMAPLR